MSTTNERYKLNKELAQMLKGGVIMDVTTPEQAKIAEAAGACAVMALERIPADIRAAGGVSRMSDPKMIEGIQNAVSIPVMAKCRIGHFVEAQVLEAIEIDYIDESEVLSPADDIYHINKRDFKVPFVCGAKDLGEALRRINEGASMIRTKGEPGTGDIVQAVRHMRKMNSEIAKLTSMREDELFEAAKTLQVPYELVSYVHDNGRLPVVNFAAGGVATPADAALMMQLGAEGVFVGSGIFKSGNPAKRAASIVKAVTNYTDAKLIAELSRYLGEALQGDFAEHEKVLDRLGVSHIELRQASDLDQPFDALILPGGESTVQSKLLKELEMFEPLKKRIENGMPVLATCAGLILLASEIEGQDSCHFGTIPMCVRRNAYGRQLGSFHTEETVESVGKVPMTFIRAPYVSDVYEDTKILASVEDRIVGVQYKNQLAFAFHPELDEDTRIHKKFLEIVRNSCN